MRQNKTVLSNFSYLAILEVFNLIAPLITYPYLVKVLGTDIYGWVITAQITASYASILIDFGFRRVSAKHVAQSRDDKDKMSVVVTSVMYLRGILWVVAFLLYMGVVCLIPAYRAQWLLFLVSYGLTFGNILFPDFYFQGIEQLKYVSIANLAVRAFFVAATFIVITGPADYVGVPLLWSIGYFIGGAVSIYIVYFRHGLTFTRPRLRDLRFHFKESFPIFVSDVMLNFKDKFNYNLMGAMVGMSDVVIYDVGSKIVNLLAKPTNIICQVIFPRMARKPNVRTTKRMLLGLVVLSVLMVAVVYIFLPQIVRFFIHEDIDLFAIRLYLLAPIFTGISFYIPSSVFVAFGYNKYVLYSTYFSTACYALLLLAFWGFGLLTTVTGFVLLTVSSYFTETMFRLYLSHTIFRRHNAGIQPPNPAI